MLKQLGESSWMALYLTVTVPYKNDINNSNKDKKTIIKSTPIFNGQQGMLKN